MARVTGAPLSPVGRRDDQVAAHWDQTGQAKIRVDAIAPLDPNLAFAFRLQRFAALDNPQAAARARGTRATGARDGQSGAAGDFE